MPSEKRGLGRGFDALIPTQLDTEFDPTAKTDGAGRVSGDEVVQVSVGNVVPNPHQPRTDFEPGALDELTASVKEHGIFQPLIVTKTKDGYQLIAGERRLRAAKQAGLDTVPVIVRSYTEQEKLELALIENLQRQDLNPIETATAYRKLMDQFNLSYDDIATRVGRDVTTVVNSTRLLGLPIEAKRAVAAGQISEGHARTILSMPTLEKQLALLEMIVKNGWSVRQAEAFARDFKKDVHSAKSVEQKHDSYRQLTNDLGRYLGTKVSIVPTAKGGRLQIEYYSDEELQRIYDAIKRD